MFSLSKTRRKRAVPEDWANADIIESFKPRKIESPIPLGSRFLTLDPSGQLALLGGSGSTAEVFSIAKNEVVRTLEAGGGTITDGLWAGDRVIVSTSLGAVNIFEKDSTIASFPGHSGEATAIALHPSGEILASVGVDKSFIFYDLSSSSIATQIYTNSCKLNIYRSLAKLTTYQLYLQRLFILMDICSQLVQQMDRLKCTM